MLITIEGVSGAGKSTLVRNLTAQMRAAGREVVDLAEREAATADPAWQLGHLMRAVTTPFGAHESALLYAARTAGRARLAREHLAAHPFSIVMADRLDLSLTVQLRRAGLDTATCRSLLALATQGLPSSLTILLDVSFREHVRRLRERGHPPLAEQTFSALREAFLQEYDRCPPPCFLVDSSCLTAAEVEAIAIDQVTPLVVPQGA
ncbi:hypothetical protein ALI22I_07715 [Saccharothrix sp. ALI-22-I]|uniref:dTMP kinase n=1 Tax=Saccharothrix sp. ALI-22-I TaxID=1933778 RepID=UPI00097C0406|nr:hypothetical protein [Saccharothrix sp. ALI-22-I]ONI91745.1 hypothetical protein ALI22I_07715 [Saccharothrix sp. ALI-22-I]